MPAMRVLIATDKFAGTLSAVEAAQAMAAGWLSHAPTDEVVQLPMADGGPGFVDVLAASLGGELLSVSVAGPHGEDVPGAVLMVDDVAYVESAQACGIHLAHGDGPGASSFGVGELMLAAVEAGARTIVVGLGGSGSNDAGAGLLAALGASADVDLTAGGVGLCGIGELDLTAAREALAGVAVVAASDVDNPLTGLFGATKVFGPQKGVGEEQIAGLDAILEEFAAVADKRLSLEKGAGAAGGIGYALLLLGATRQPGIELVARAVGLPDRVAQSDLVITGEGAFDWSSRAGKVPFGVAEIANAALRPCIVLAGQVLVGSREMRALGIESAHSTTDLVGQERSFRDPAGSLEQLAARVARSWSR